MPQRAPHPIVPSDGSELDSNELDSPSVAVDTSSTTSRSLVSNSHRQQQHGDIEIVWCLQENQMLKNDNHTLGEKNKTLSSNQRQCSSTQVLDKLKVFDVELSTFSRKYGVVAEMFPPEHRILKLVVPNPPPAILSGSCYASKNHLHRFVPTLHFQSLLEQQLQGGRSSEIGKLRIQKMLGMTGSRSSSSKFPPVLFMRQERDPMMSMVFGNWEPLAKVLIYLSLPESALTLFDIAGWPHAKCNARKWGITSCTPGLLAWGWVTLIFILSPDTSFTKDGVGAKSHLLYAAMFTAYKQLWVMLWEEPRILSICQKIDHRVWQSTSSSNVVTSDVKGKDLTPNLMRLALANAGCEDSDSDSLTPDNHHAPPVAPNSLTLALATPPAVPALAITPAAETTIIPAAENIITLGPITILPAVPVFLTADESPPVPDGPNNMEMLPTAASSSSRWGQGRGKNGGLVAMSLSVEQRET
ncbi:hypothetical protein BDR03DRAFT_1018515 [Suillus americanus]|nr:hypothetical protein BDR03DRAFT_1018515 [Suillus americanus]